MKNRLALIAGVIAAGFTGGTGYVHQRVKGKATIHCKSKYKPHQGVNEKSRRMRQMGITALEKAA
jgi:hypothetical protein